MNQDRTQSLRSTTESSPKPISRWLAIAPLALALGLTGCYARATTRAAVVYDEPTVEVSTMPVQVVPAQIEYYPSYQYRGSYAYLVDGQWYYRSRGNWTILRSEPRVLADVRVRYETRYGRHYRPRPEVASPAPRPHHRPHRH